ncbi:MAG: hypothetical protein EBT06_06180 [Gammaproteobacteria bacterium]|nr:hypothetical protein [Gammaproteobacteria bacterium]NBY23889.1 hypothetical protein [Gammaproteobacteria bacterium]
MGKGGPRGGGVCEGENLGKFTIDGSGLTTRRMDCSHKSNQTLALGGAVLAPQPITFGHEKGPSALNHSFDW